ncbi:uncharacterized protein [Triticum aestivum]|uniref:uncharacterized protein n=1 Tax=Triticum aestivum TaxID=4565 RepID=UPI001D02C226|nr:uncharacterized protein LOC123150649 [Triticum aestivum]
MVVPDRLAGDAREYKDPPRRLEPFPISPKISPPTPLSPPPLIPSPRSLSPPSELCHGRDAETDVAAATTVPEPLRCVHVPYDIYMGGLELGVPASSGSTPSSSSSTTAFFFNFVVVLCFDPSPSMLLHNYRSDDGSQEPEDATDDY